MMVCTARGLRPGSRVRSSPQTLVRLAVQFQQAWAKRAFKAPLCSGSTPPVLECGSPLSLKRKLPPLLLALTLLPMNLSAWTNGELSIWMDNDRAKGLAPIAQKFEDDFGIKITIETPEKITDSFPMAAQAGKGPDVVVWAHDKVGEWADAGLIRPIEVSDEFSRKYFPKAWQAVLHRGWIWDIQLPSRRSL